MLSQKILDRLKEELTVDPLNFGYATKTPDEISELLNKPYVRQVQAVENQTPRLPVIINEFLGKMLRVPADLEINENGQVISNHPAIKTGVDAVITNEASLPFYVGKTINEAIEMMKVPQTVQVNKDVENYPRVYFIIQGIPESPNKFTTQDIIDAQT